MTVAAPLWKVVWITGASSGIGRGLALKLAAEGSVVAISARSADKLAEVAALSPNIRAYALDVTDAAACAHVAARIAADLGPIDLAVLNAGVLHMATVDKFDLVKTQAALAVNYGGVLNCLAPVMPAMIARADGHIAFVSSVAGYRGLPLAHAYAPTKSALISLAESLNGELRMMGVRTSIINPGFIATPMTDHAKIPMPFMVSEDFAVAAMLRGLKRGKFEIVFPWQMKVLMKAYRRLPYPLFHRWFLVMLERAVPRYAEIPDKPLRRYR